MKWIKIVGKIIAALLLVLLVAAVVLYWTVLRYPNLKENPKVGKWYRVAGSAMKDSEGNRYHALFKKGSENNVMIYFAGGGVSINEETARDDTYNTRMVWPDLLANVTMNMGGLASGMEDSPFENWSILLFPYATDDFHAGTGEFRYTDTDGSEKTLYHNGYVNYSAAMEQALARAGIEHAESVVVTGYSAGGFASALLAGDVFANYFPNAASKTVLIDSALLLHEDWHDIAANVWQTPQAISGKLTGDNLTLDCLTALREAYGADIHLLFTCSTRDGDLAKVQNYFDTGAMEVDEPQADRFQQLLCDTVPQMKEIGVSLFLWDGIPWYDDPRDLTAHTIIATPAVWLPFDGPEQSVAGWLADAVNGVEQDYGMELVRD